MDLSASHGDVQPKVVVLRRPAVFLLHDPPPTMLGSHAKTSLCPDMHL